MKKYIRLSRLLSSVSRENLCITSTNFPPWKISSNKAKHNVCINFVKIQLTDLYIGMEVVVGEAAAATLLATTDNQGVAIDRGISFGLNCYLSTILLSYGAMFGMEKKQVPISNREWLLTTSFRDTLRLFWDFFRHFCLNIWHSALNQDSTVQLK